MTSPVVQWLRIRLAMQGSSVRSVVEELRSHMPQGVWARPPQLLSLCTVEPAPHKEEPARHSGRCHGPQLRPDAAKK